MVGRRSSSIITSTALSGMSDLVHGVATGVQGPLTFRHGSELSVQAARDQFYRSLGIQAGDVVLGEQVHGSSVAVVSHRDRGAGRFPATYLPATDGLVTSEPGIMLGVYSADCIPILAYDPQKRVVGIAHAGWKGISTGIIQNLLKQLVTTGAQRQHLWVWLGPSIHPCCYDFTEKRDDRLRRFRKHFGERVIEHRAGRTFLNLQASIKLVLAQSNVPQRNVSVDPSCTFHDARGLPSARRQGSARQRVLLAVIGMRDPLDSLAGKRVLVLGLGVHGGGVDTARWLVRHRSRVTVTDLKRPSLLRSSIEKLRGLPVHFVLGRHRRKDVEASDVVVANPAVPRTAPVLRNAASFHIPVENDASIFFRYCPVPIIGITGTKGKTATTVLTESMLSKSGRSVVAVGHNQTPLLGFLDRIHRSSIVIAELSSWRLELLAKRKSSPHVAVVTNLMPDHLNTYATFASYLRAKQNAIAFQHHDDIAILNWDNRHARALCSLTRAQVQWFSLVPQRFRNGAFIDQGVAYVIEHGHKHRLFRTADVKRRSPHELQELLAASLAARTGGASLSAIRSVALYFQGIAHRLQEVTTIRGIRYVNDTSATIPEAVIAAIETVRGGIILIAGGVDKGLNYQTLGKIISSKCRAVVLFQGSATDKILPYLSVMPVAIAITMRQAVHQAAALAQPGDTVILSPGAASFGLFAHEFDRGDQFIAQVQQLP